MLHPEGPFNLLNSTLPDNHVIAHQTRTVSSNKLTGKVVMSVTHHMANPQFLPEIFSAAAENLPYASQDRKAHCKFASCPENILKKPCRWGQTVSLLWHVWTADQATWTSCSSDRRGGEGRRRGRERRRKISRSQERSELFSALQPERPNPSRSRTGGGQGVGADPAVALSR